MPSSEETKNRLDEVSSTFCLAKWLQSTTHLFNGTTHSCHHNNVHKISEDEVKADPSRLHNTPIKFAARKEMLAGIQTKECDYCWRVENLDENLVSDRIQKSSLNLFYSDFDKVVASGEGHTIFPTNFEMSFENTCNFKCVYCSPTFSSKWGEEIKTYGGFNLPSGVLYPTVPHSYGSNDENPFIDAFWKWWPTLQLHLKLLRITGGEPLLSKHLWRLLDWLIDNPKPELVLAINTNMGVPDKLIDQLIQYANLLNGKVKLIKIFTSGESWGEHLEYSRFGLQFDKYKGNIEKVLEQTGTHVSVHCSTTVNILCYASFHQFVDWFLALRKKYLVSQGQNRVGVWFSFLRWPFFLSVSILPGHLKNFMIGEIRRVKENPLLISTEFEQLGRLIEIIKTEQPNKADLLEDLKMFIAECDLRRGTNFKKVFPELAHL